MMRIISVAHALRLRHVDLLREMPIEKDIIHIKLAKTPLLIEGNAKHSTDGDGIGHETKSFVKVNIWLLVKVYVWLLVKASSNKASFIPCNRAFGILFDAKHPFVA